MLPIPELYLQYAIVAKHRELFRQMRRLTVLNNMQHRQLALRMLSLFTYKTLPSITPWEDKVPRAVYRGSCFPTVNPWGDQEDAEPVFFLRGEACKVARRGVNTSLLDYGLRVDHAFTDGCNPKYVLGFEAWSDAFPAQQRILLVAMQRLRAVCRRATPRYTNHGPAQVHHANRRVRDTQLSSMKHDPTSGMARALTVSTGS